MREKTLKIVNYICIAIYVVTLGIAVYLNLGKTQGLIMCGAAVICPLLMPALLKILKIKAPLEFHIVNIVFMYFASLWGSCLGGYSTLFFDKIIHCLSGVLVGEVAYVVYKYYLREDRRKSLMFIFMTAFNACVAVFWEFYEYALLVFINNDAINHYSQGVHDSMQDMLVAVLGCFVLTLYLMKYDQDNKPHFFVELERKFSKMNNFLKHKEEKV